VVAGFSTCAAPHNWTYKYMYKYIFLRK